MGVIQAADELGIRIPADLSLIGFDNIFEAKYMGLTTIDLFLEHMGYVAIQMLIKLINQEPLEEEVHKMRTKLIVRTSCQKLAGSTKLQDLVGEKNLA